MLLHWKKQKRTYDSTANKSITMDIVSQDWLFTASVGYLQHDWSQL